MMHSMEWLRRVITDHYDKLLRDKNRELHHQGVRRGVPGFWKNDGATQPGAPGERQGGNHGRSASNRERTRNCIGSAAPATRKGRCPVVPEGRCSPYYISGACPRDHRCKHLIHECPNLNPRKGRPRSQPAAPYPCSKSGKRKGRGRSKGSRAGSPAGSRGSRNSQGVKLSLFQYSVLGLYTADYATSDLPARNIWACEEPALESVVPETVNASSVFRLAAERATFHRPSKPAPGPG